MDKFRLTSQKVKPLLYSILIKPNLKLFTYSGKTVIDLKVEDTLDKLKFNSVGLFYKKLILTQNGHTLLQKIQNSANENLLTEKDESVIIDLPTKLRKGSAKLELKFSGTISNALDGLYRAVYNDGDKTKHLAVTQFEPASARKVFPCWDEPTFKARFKISVLAEKGMTAVSNMQISKMTKNVDGTVLYHFEESPLMSTYLVALIVGELGKISGKGATSISVYAEPNSVQKCNFALDSAQKFLDFYNEFFGIDYPLAKMDMAAIPDFAAGAMENWGLITYRDSAILLEESPSQRARERVAVTVAHEIAHQWFGNLVTMEWWTDLWLNEGFASFMEIKATQKIFPLWNVEEQFVSEQLSSALNLDSFDSSHPIEVEVHSPGEVDEIFDRISYEKGALVVRMLSNFMGEQNFTDGIRRYIKKFQYRNTVTADLWEALSTGPGGEGVKKVMEGFTKQKGYPIVFVEENFDFRGSLNLSQKKFQTRVSQEKPDTLWSVPIVTLNEQPHILGEGTLLLNAPENFVVNLNAGGFFRTKFSDKLLVNINLGKLPVLNVFSLLNDSFALSFLGSYSSMKSVFVLMERLKGINKTNNVVIWSEICGILDTLRKLNSIEANKNFDANFKRFSFSILEPKYLTLGWNFLPGESLERSKLRVDTIRTLANFDHPEVIQKGVKEFEDYLFNGLVLNADIRPVIFKIGCQNASSETFKKFAERILSSEDTNEKIYGLMSMGYFSDIEVLGEYLNKVGKNIIRDQDFSYFSNSVAQNGPEGAEIVWGWLKENFAELSMRFKGNRFSDFIKMLRWFGSEEKALEIEQYFRDKDRSGYEMALSQTLEDIRIKADFLGNREDERAWIKRWNGLA